jgi:hypothetical protein
MLCCGVRLLYWCGQLPSFATQAARNDKTTKLLPLPLRLQETQSYEKRLILSQQECWSLRVSLLAAKTGSAASAMPALLHTAQA